MGLATDAVVSQGVLVGGGVFQRLVVGSLMLLLLAVIAKRITTAVRYGLIGSSSSLGMGRRVVVGGIMGLLFTVGPTLTAWLTTVWASCSICRRCCSFSLYERAVADRRMGDTAVVTVVA